MSYSFGKPTPLDAEVAVRCFDFRWFANKKQKSEEGKKPLCCLHVGPEWREKGWIRWNWSEEVFDELPSGTVWPDPDQYDVFVDWGRAIGKDHEYPYRGTQYMNLPTFSQNWLACGMVIEWLQEKLLKFAIRPSRIDYTTQAREEGAMLIEEDMSLMEAICRVAIEVSKLENG